MSGPHDFQDPREGVPGAESEGTGAGNARRPEALGS